MTTYHVPEISLQEAAQVATAGDTVFVHQGIYDGLIRVHGVGTAGRPVTFTGEPGAILTGGFIPDTWPGDDVIGGAHGNPYLVFQGLTFVGRDSRFQLRLSTGSAAVSCLFEAGKNGINARGDRVWIAGNTFRTLDEHAYVVYGSYGSVIEGNHLHRINVRGLINPSASAVSKFGFTENLTVKTNMITDCRGPGIWLDGGNINYRLYRNRILRCSGKHHVSEGAGIQTEINPGPGLIDDNTIEGCSGAGIAVLESADVRVLQNHIRGGYAGVELRNDQRGPRIRNVVIEGNEISDLVSTAPVRIAAIKCAVGDPPAAGEVISRGNTFNVGVQALYDWFGVKAYTIAEAQAMGFEV